MNDYSSHGLKASIIKAIKCRKILKIWYDPGWRLIEPHVLGYSSDHHLLLRAYQVSGALESGRMNGWRLFRSDQIGQIEEMSEQFKADHPDYNPRDKQMVGGIIAAAAISL